MPHCNRLLLPVAIAALLTAGTAHAEGRRSAQSVPTTARFSQPAPAPLRTATPGKTSREEPQRGQLAQRGERERDDASNRGRSERERYDNRRHDSDRDEYEQAKEREGHHFEHHGHDDSPGC